MKVVSLTFISENEHGLFYEVETESGLFYRTKRTNTVILKKNSYSKFDTYATNWQTGEYFGPTLQFARNVADIMVYDRKEKQNDD